MGTASGEQITDNLQDLDRQLRLQRDHRRCFRAGNVPRELRGGGRTRLRESAEATFLTAPGGLPQRINTRVHTLQLRSARFNAALQIALCGAWLVLDVELSERAEGANPINRGVRRSDPPR